VAVWTLAVIIGLFFVLAGFSKVAGPLGTDWAVRLSHWGYPAASRYAIGGIEILAGLGLLLPALKRLAAVTLMVVMAGALLTHLLHSEFVRVLPPLILGGLSFGLYSWQPRAPRELESSRGSIGIGVDTSDFPKE
jgi:putative oxidoreductase